MRAKPESIDDNIHQFHVFDDEYDEWFSSYRAALTHFKRLRAEGYQNIRIYLEVFDTENELRYEEYLKGIGRFPF